MNETILAPSLLEKTEPRWEENLAPEIYHANKDFVGSSSLRKILKSPKTFYADFFQGNEEEPTQAMKFGTLAHMAILEGDKFREKYRIMPDFGDQRSKENKAKKGAWLFDQPPGSVICTQEEFDSLIGMIESVVNHADAFRILKDGKTEISGFYNDPVTGIACKIRPDFISFNLGALVDVKTTIDCSLHSFSKTIWDHRYDIQMMMYCAGAEIISGKKIDFPAFIAVEKKAPFEVAVYTADEAMGNIGLEDYKGALGRLKESLQSGVWDSYQKGVQNIHLPFWAIQSRN